MHACTHTRANNTNRADLCAQQAPCLPLAHCRARAAPTHSEHHKQLLPVVVHQACAARTTDARAYACLANGAYPPSLSLSCPSFAAQVDDWHFDTFELNDVTNGRPLSTLAFALFSRSSLMAHFKISDIKLAR